MRERSEAGAGEGSFENSALEGDIAKKMIGRSECQHDRRARVRGVRRSGKKHLPARRVGYGGEECSHVSETFQHTTKGTSGNFLSSEKERVTLNMERGGAYSCVVVYNT